MIAVGGSGGVKLRASARTSSAVTRAAAQRSNIEIFLYAEAGHSFFNPIRPGYHAASAKLAGKRLDALVDLTLATAPA